MRQACIDIGSNTTALLVAEMESGSLRQVLQQRDFTLLGSSVGSDDMISEAKVDEVVSVVTTQIGLAAQVDAPAPIIVATASVREAANGDDLMRKIEAKSHIGARILTIDEEAQFGFAGATANLGFGADEPVCVMDIGGGSTELSIGTAASGAAWCTSFKLGSGSLTRSYIKHDPPTIAEINTAQLHARGIFEGLEMPLTDRFLAIGGSARSLRKIIGNVFDHETLGRALRTAGQKSSSEIVNEFGLTLPRARMLAASLSILDAFTEMTGKSIALAKGGVREGILLEALTKSAHP